MDAWRTNWRDKNLNLETLHRYEDEVIHRSCRKHKLQIPEGKDPAEKEEDDRKKKKKKKKSCGRSPHHGHRCPPKLCPFSR